MKKKVLISVCLLLSVSLFYGCKKSETSDTSNVQQTTETSLSTQSNDADNNNDINESDILKHINSMVFHGTNINFPCNLGLLDDEIDLKYGIYSKDAEYTYYSLQKQDEQILAIGLSGNVSEPNEDDKIVMMVIKDEQLSELTVDGKSCDTDVYGIIDIFGDPDTPVDNVASDKWKTIIEYIRDDVVLSISFNNGHAHEITFTKKG